jgi:hypothetical protein
MNFSDLRRRADVVRAVPLEAVLLVRGAERDAHDRRKWHTERGPLSVTGAKFMNWHRSEGGGGAIDLVMHLTGVEFLTAVKWLEEHFASSPLAVRNPAASAPGNASSAPAASGGLWLPVPNDRLLGRVCHYLTRRRCLSGSLIEPLVQDGKLYADCRANAVFLLVAGKASRPVGAELRGTGPRVWHGMASGTRKDLGYFWIGAMGSREIVLCESAIDAISCFQMRPECICISTAGVRADPPWLRELLAHGYQLFCGFDADLSGDAEAARMIALYPAVRRLRPPAHDWNDVLTSGR